MVPSSRGWENGRRMTGAILIVDDNISIREVLTDILDSIAATIFTAANGQEGLEILQQHRQIIGLVLLDMNMPVLNGEQTYEKLQEITPDVKVIVLTSLSKAEVQYRFGYLETPTYLQKPFEVDTLLNVVQAELANSLSSVAVS
ncbi:MAG: response regulator [Candidatus Promineifilaceae bacterium]